MNTPRPTATPHPHQENQFSRRYINSLEAHIKIARPPMHTRRRCDRRVAGRRRERTCRFPHHPKHLYLRPYIPGTAPLQKRFLSKHPVKSDKVSQSRGPPAKPACQGI